MGDMGDDFRAMREYGKRKRASNRESSAKLLSENGIEFESKNDGAHLVIRVLPDRIDFWPGTGKWIADHVRPKSGYGVKSLIRYIEERRYATTR